MINKIFRTVYFAIVSIVLISILFATWTSYVFFAEASKASEINKVIKDMYQSEKSFVIDVFDLTKILVQDSSQNIYSESNALQGEEGLATEQGISTQLEEPLPIDENVDNSLGAVVEPIEESQSLDEEKIDLVTKETFPTAENSDNPLMIVIEPIDESLDSDNEGIELPMNEMNMDDYSNLEP